MTVPLAAYLDVIAPHASERLLAGREFAAVRAVAAKLPATPIAGFERTLGSTLGGTDFALHFQAGDGFAEELRAAVACGRLDGPIWRAIVALVDAEPCGSTTAMGIGDIWLEFDVSAGASAPSVFVSPIDPTPTRTVAEFLWRHTFGPDLSDSILASLDRLDALPGRAVHVARLLPRQSDPVRICMRGVGPASMRTMLEAFELPSSLLDCALTHRFAHQPSRMVFAVDIDESGLRPQFGIEFLPSGATTDAHVWWDDALRRLVEDGLCAEQERRDLLAWCGQSHYRNADIWPTGLCVVRSGALEVAPVFDRRLHHFKIGFDGERLSAKIYYGFVLTWQPVSSTASAMAVVE